MIEELEKIVKRVIKETVKDDAYKKKVTIDESKVTVINIGKVSY